MQEDILASGYMVRTYSFHFSDMPCMLIIYRSNIHRCRNVPLGGRFVVPFGTALDKRTFGRSGSIWIFPLLYARVESELESEVKPSNLITLVILYWCDMNIVIADVMCYL